MEFPAKKMFIYINIIYKKINLHTYKKKLILLLPTIIFGLKIQKKQATNAMNFNDLNKKINKKGKK